MIPGLISTSASSNLMFRLQFLSCSRTIAKTKRSLITVSQWCVYFLATRLSEEPQLWLIYSTLGKISDRKAATWAKWSIVESPKDNSVIASFCTPSPGLTEGWESVVVASITMPKESSFGQFLIKRSNPCKVTLVPRLQPWRVPRSSSCKAGHASTNSVNQSLSRENAQTGLSRTHVKCVRSSSGLIVLISTIGPSERWVGCGDKNSANWIEDSDGKLDPNMLQSSLKVLVVSVSDIMQSFMLVHDVAKLIRGIQSAVLWAFSSRHCNAGKRDGSVGSMLGWCDDKSRFNVCKLGKVARWERARCVSGPHVNFSRWSHLDTRSDTASMVLLEGGEIVISISKRSIEGCMSLRCGRRDSAQSSGACNGIERQQSFVPPRERRMYGNISTWPKIQANSRRLGRNGASIQKLNAWNVSAAISSSAFTRQQPSVWMREA